MKKTTIRNLIYSLIVLMLFGAVMLVLTHTAQNGMETTQILPQINPEPSASPPASPPPHR